MGLGCGTPTRFMPAAATAAAAARTAQATTITPALGAGVKIQNWTTGHLSIHKSYYTALLTQIGFQSFDGFQLHNTLFHMSISLEQLWYRDLLADISSKI